MKALMAEIKVRERQSSRSASKNDLTSAAEHYKSVLVKEESSLTDVGYQLGSQHVLQCVLSPSTIREILRIQDSGQWTAFDQQIVRDAIGKDTNTVGKAAEAANGEEEALVWKLSMLRGYVAGVAEAWQQVCKQINEAN